MIALTLVSVFAYLSSATASFVCLNTTQNDFLTTQNGYLAGNGTAAIAAINAAFPVGDPCNRLALRNAINLLRNMQADVVISDKFVTGVNSTAICPYKCCDCGKRIPCTRADAQEALAIVNSAIEQEIALLANVVAEDTQASCNVGLGGLHGYYGIMYCKLGQLIRSLSCCRCSA